MGGSGGRVKRGLRRGGPAVRRDRGGLRAGLSVQARSRGHLTAVRPQREPGRGVEEVSRVNGR